MAISLKHATQATGTDAGNGEIHKAEWNAEHAISGTLDIANGGTGQSSATAAANALDGYLAVTSAAGTTTLTATSPRVVYVSGSTTQTIQLPDTSTLQVGWSYTIINGSSNGGVSITTSTSASVNSSIGSNIAVRVTCISTASNTASAWVLNFLGSNTRTGTSNVVFSNAPSLSSPVITTPSITFTSSASATAGTNAQGQGNITTDNVVVGTTSANPSGVTLPSASAGRRIFVTNKGTNPINVYPGSGGTIDALSANASIQIPVGGQIVFNASSTTQWYSSYNLWTSALYPNVTNTVSVGYTLTPNSIGTVSSGTTTLNPALGNYQYMINNGASSLSPPSNGTYDAIDLLVINGPSAGSLTFTAGKWRAGSSTGSTYSTSSRSSATVTISNASPAVVTWTAHGCADGDPIYLTTTGALPTGLTASTVYYVKYVDANSFQVSTTPGGTSINTSSAGSGTHTGTACSQYVLSVRQIYGSATYSWYALQ